jgi:hypothetical protein
MGIKVFLIFLLDDGRIRSPSRIRTWYIGIRIREAKNIPYGSSGSGSAGSGSATLVFSALIEGALRSFQEWIAEDIQNISVSKIFQMAPFLRHSIPDVIFFFAWLTKFSSGRSSLYSC